MNRCSKAGRRSKWTRTLRSHIVNSVKLSSKNACITKRLGNFKEQSRFPKAMRYLMLILLMLTPSQGVKEAMKIAKDLEDRQSQHSSTDASIALIHLGLGDKGQAMVRLSKAYQARFNPSILVRPAFDPLRSDARFRDLLRRIGLPQVTPDRLD